MRGATVRAILVTAAALLTGADSSASAAGPLLGANVDRSVVDLAMLAPNGSQVVFSEVLPSGARVSLGRDVARNATGGPDGAAELRRAATWSCDRLERTFVGSAATPAGALVEAATTVRTPSCRDRLLLTVPRRIERGGKMRTTIRDRWGLGGIDVELCVRRKGHEKRCRSIAIPAGESTVTSTRRVSRRKGLIDIDARLGRHHVRTQTGVGRTAPRRSKPTLLLTGDSMIQGIDSFVADRLRSRYRVVSDTRPGSGVSKPGDFDWRRHARRQVRRHGPAVTMVFLGANDRFAMPLPSGGESACCTREWVGEYLRRIRTMARAWARDGRGRILWATIPPPRDVRYATAIGAVNAAIVELARREPEVELVRLDRTFSASGRYVERIEGVGVRDADGLHLSVAGERIAAAAFADAEKAVGGADD